MNPKAYFFLFIIFFNCNQAINAQQDTTYRVDISDLQDERIGRGDYRGGGFFKRNPYRAIIVPTALIGVGALLIDNPVYDRRDFHRDIFNTFPNFRGTRIDDYLIYSPYVTLVGLNLIKIPCENDFINTSLIILKSEIINLTLTFALKKIVGIERPNGRNFQSWPSGHTSEAFLAATIVNREYRRRSPWIGVAAYGLASTVGFFRILNNAHWLSDVVAGAGIGILSANITYLTHRWRFGRPGTCLLPSLNNGQPGVYFSYSF